MHNYILLRSCETNQVGFSLPNVSLKVIQISTITIVKHKYLLLLKFRSMFKVSYSDSFELSAG